MTKELEKHKQTFSKNPFIEIAKENTKVGVKTIFGKKEHKTYHIITDYEDEDKESTEDSITFGKKQFVDKDQFVKLYISGFETLSNLKNSSKLTFSYIFNQIRKEVGQDRYYFSYKDYCSFCEEENIDKISSASFWRAIKELLENDVIAKSKMENLYFLNIAYVFNGDRMQFIQEYELKEQERKNKKAAQNKS